MWTTVAYYVISQAGEKLLEVASPIHQPDNFMGLAGHKLKYVEVLRGVDSRGLDQSWTTLR